jgi:hypothetical protein
MFLSPAGAASQTAPIVIERVQPERWRASYTFDHPVTSLRFGRRAANHRERVWRVVTPGYRWATRDGETVLQLDPGAQAGTAITIEFPEFTDPLPKEYELFQPFSDGAVALYTGHFYVTPEGPAYNNAPLLQTVRLAPPPGTHAIVRGRISSGTVTFADGIGDGTYIYVGTQRPIETPHLVAVVDPGMPRWVRQLYETRLPQLFTAYTARFGRPLPWKPTVLYSFHDTAAAGYESGGGTLTGLISMTLTGSEWHKPLPEAMTQAFQLLAHEAAHLWNGQLITSVGGPGSWMHEGSADAFANEMLLEFGVIDSAAWLDRRADAVNRCAAHVLAAPVHRAAERGAFRTFYDCGFVMALWTEMALRETSPSTDLFGFWRDLITKAQSTGGRYDEDLYFGVMRSAGVADSVVEQMRAFLSSSSIEPAVAGLSSLGLDIVQGKGTPPAEYQRTISMKAFAHVMAAACDRISFNLGVPIVTQAIPDCNAFATPLRVYGVQDFRIAGQVAELYDAVVATCAAGGTLRVQGERGETLASVQCRRELAPRPSWYEFPR